MINNKYPMALDVVSNLLAWNNVPLENAWKDLHSGHVEADSRMFSHDQSQQTTKLAAMKRGRPARHGFLWLLQAMIMLLGQNNKIGGSLMDTHNMTGWLLDNMNYPYIFDDWSLAICGKLGGAS